MVTPSPMSLGVCSPISGIVPPGTSSSTRCPFSPGHIRSVLPSHHQASDSWRTRLRPDDDASEGPPSPGDVAARGSPPADAAFAYAASTATTESAASPRDGAMPRQSPRGERRARQGARQSGTPLVLADWTPPTTAPGSLTFDMLLLVCTAARLPASLLSSTSSTLPSFPSSGVRRGLLR